MSTILTILYTIVILGVLITVHEAGHFLAARSFGVLVDEFAIGFGPKLWGTQDHETKYSIRMLPLGGYCRIAGMEDDQARDRPVPPGRSFNEHPLWQRMTIVGAGALMNFALAVIMFALVFGGFGTQTPTLEVQQVMEDFPAAEAGIQPGDRIETVNGEPVSSWDELVQIIQVHADEPVEVQLQRGSQMLTLTLTPETRDGVGFIGIQPAAERQRLGPLQSVYRGFALTGTVVVESLRAVGQMIGGEPGPQTQFVGVVGIGAEIGRAAQSGVGSLIMLAALVSTSLGLINVLPLPALDGGRLVFLTLEGIRGRPVDPEKEAFVHFIGFALLMVLAIVITYQDIVRLT